MQRQAEPGGVDARPLDLLGDHDVVAEVVDAAAAVLLGHGHAEEPVVAGAREQRSVDDPGVLPLLVVGDELLGDERPDAVAEQLVLVVEERPAHATHPRLDPMTPTTAIVVAGGDEVDDQVMARLPKDALVVAADSGATQAARLGLTVDVLVGDFDSLAADDVDRAERQGATVERHPPDKDKTDLKIAIDAAVARGAAEIVVVASTGGRVDHTIANVLVLASPAYAAVQVDALIGPARLHVVRGGRPRDIEGTPGELVTLMAMNGPAIGVTTEGLAYALDGDDLRPGTSRGVSNVFTEAIARIALGEGTLLAIVPTHPADPAGFPHET